MKYSFVVAALIGVLSFDQVQKVKASQQIESNQQFNDDQTLLQIQNEDDQIDQNEQEEQSEEGDEDDEDVQVNDDENQEDEDDEQDGESGDEHDEDTLIYQGESIHQDDDEDVQDQDDDEEEEEDKDVQLDQNQEFDINNGEFEQLDDSLVHEDMALEMEQLNFEYRPHNVETIALASDDEKEDDAEEEEEESGDDGPEDESNVQLSDDYFTVEMNGHPDLGEKTYERVVPARFVDGGDPFMFSMINNYALEGKNEDGTPNGKFFMNESITRQASLEILKAHKKLEGKEAEDYMKQYFERTWAHFDVTKDGILDVDTMPQFMRFLASDQSLDLS